METTLTALLEEDNERLHKRIRELGMVEHAYGEQSNVYTTSNISVWNVLGKEDLA